MAHRFHVPMTVTPDYIELFDYKGAFDEQLLSLRLQFFDYYLKGKNNGFTDIEPVQLYTAYKGWESFKNYPPAATTYETYFFNEKNQLSKDTSASGIDAYEVDFTHASNYDAEEDNRWNMATTCDEVMIRTDLDKKCLVYETAVLENNLQVTGHSIVAVSYTHLTLPTKA